MDIWIAGVGMTPFGRHPDKSVRDLTETAVGAALADAGLGAPDVGAAFFGNAVQGAIEGQYGIRGQIALRDVPLGPIPIVNVENACASATTALHLAIGHVQTGVCDIALAIGAEKMVHPDSAVSMTAFEGSWERGERDRVIGRLTDLGLGTPTPPQAAARETPHSVFMDVYAAFAKWHMAEYGTTEAQIARIASKNHGHSVHNDRSQFRRPFSVEEILGARLIAWPFTLPMCSAISDGAAAAVVCNKRGLARVNAARAVRLRAAVLMHGGRRAAQDYASHISRQASARAYEIAGLGPADIDVVECHDATAFGELQQSELLGFTALGGGGALADSGATTLGGRIPFNPSGGLESRGHPIGATGLAQTWELVTQLRGEAGPRQIEGARIALAENGGGLMGVEEAAIGITIYEAAS
ncbi:thiolase family protein [Antarcticimicrobium luteum]|uniref:Thiolase family protein n=1 Tax=Antarcticimicrobium luteum TaxID=2547397 RepID=A0A4R5V1T6_9RHOB|nr:thiolase family protein [Antarcticimicrobium luteum]TDK45709.1 thiolase family protein [Antarcticimicrobium luteum]